MRIWTAALILIAGLLVASCGGGGSDSSTTTSGGGATGAQVVMKNLAFDPASITVKVGESITWTNQDGFTHDVKADNGEFASENIEAGGTYSTVIDKPGTYPYHCGIHPEMTGTVIVQ